MSRFQTNYWEDKIEMSKIDKLFLNTNMITFENLVALN